MPCPALVQSQAVITLHVSFKKLSFSLASIANFIFCSNNLLRYYYSWDDRSFKCKGFLRSPIKALSDSRTMENLSPFREFMYSQYNKFLQQDIDAYRLMLKPKNKGKGRSLKSPNGPNIQ